jgi:hypothetical protein
MTSSSSERKSVFDLDVLGKLVLTFIWLMAAVAIILGVVGFVNHIPGTEMVIVAAIGIFAGAFVASKLLKTRFSLRRENGPIH